MRRLIITLYRVEAWAQSINDKVKHPALRWPFLAVAIPPLFILLVVRGELEDIRVTFDIMKSMKSTFLPTSSETSSGWTATYHSRLSFAWEHWLRTPVHIGVWLTAVLAITGQIFQWWTE